MSRIDEIISLAEEFSPVSQLTIWCTPEIAKKFLEKNTRNRNLSKSVVEKYIEEIKSGEWYAMPAGIGFDSEDVLVDGQNRLEAIVASGIAVPMPIVWNLDKNCQSKIDRMKKRSLYDNMVLSGKASSRRDFYCA